MPTAPRVLLLHGVQSSATTWWRMVPDLQDLGCDVRAFDLLGHGSRPAGGPPVTLDSMAGDLEDRLDDQPVDLVVGHSMGALVALTLAAERPKLVAGLVLEDPPALGPALAGHEVASNIEQQVARARAEPSVMVTELLTRNPLWHRTDAVNDVANLRALDLEAVTEWLRAEQWDLAAMIRACPVPVHLLLAAGHGSATAPPARRQILDSLGPEHVTEVASGHSVHRDRPGIWVATALSQLSLGTDG